MLSKPPAPKPRLSAKEGRSHRVRQWFDSSVTPEVPRHELDRVDWLRVLPFVLMYASYVLYKKHYILDEDKYAEVCAELEKRRAEAK